ncbi:hypothetical protein VB773_21985 [Haloarculaceae archaeon H-GB2-1]|nr:hypothetical protein [Haloarculaceae archaeon H-GB2-1]
MEWTFGEMEVLDAETDRQLEIPVEDAATVFLKAAETGTRVTLHCGSYQWEDLSEFNMTYRLEGATGALDNGDYAPESFYGNAAKASIGNVQKAFSGEEPDYFAPTYYLQAYYTALREFVDAIRAGEQPPVSGAEGLRTVQLVEDAYDAADLTYDRQGWSSDGRHRHAGPGARRGGPRRGRRVGDVVAPSATDRGRRRPRGPAPRRPLPVPAVDGDGHEPGGRRRTRAAIAGVDAGPGRRSRDQRRPRDRPRGGRDVPRLRDARGRPRPRTATVLD